MTSPDTGTPCFISYKHSDDADLGGVIDRFQRDLGAYYAAMTGKSLLIFMDRHSIGWGDDWREKIRASVQGATIFIPMVTMRYFDSEACSEELLTFHSNARQLGVTQLILPVVVLGAEMIRPDDPREEVRLIERLQYEPLTDAWLAGYESAEWRTTIMRLVRRLDNALSSAEAALAAATTEVDLTPIEVEDDEGADFMALQAEAEELTGHLAAALESLRLFVETASEMFSGNLDGLTPGQMNARLMAAATRLRPVSVKTEETGNALLTATARFDADLRATVQELQDIGHSSADSLADSLIGPAAELEELSGSLDQMDEMMSVLKTASLMNSTLRKSLRPGIGGVQAIRTAFATVTSWSQLGGAA